MSSPTPESPPQPQTVFLPMQPGMAPTHAVQVLPPGAVPVHAVPMQQGVMPYMVPAGPQVVGAPYVVASPNAPGQHMMAMPAAPCVPGPMPIATGSASGASIPDGYVLVPAGLGGASPMGASMSNGSLYMSGSGIPGLPGSVSSVPSAAQSSDLPVLGPDNDGTQLLVNYIADDVSASELRQLFRPYGSVELVRLIRDKGTGRRKGFGFVYMGTADEAIAASRGLTGLSFHGKRLKVAVAREAQPAPKRKQHSTSSQPMDGAMPQAELSGSV